MGREIPYSYAVWSIIHTIIMSLLISEYDAAGTSTEQLGKASITLLDINVWKALTLKYIFTGHRGHKVV